MGAVKHGVEKGEGGEGMGGGAVLGFLPFLQGKRLGSLT